MGCRCKKKRCIGWLKVITLSVEKLINVVASDSDMDTSLKGSTLSLTKCLYIHGVMLNKEFDENPYILDH
jgi:hypothetical protein